MPTAGKLASALIFGALAYALALTAQKGGELPHVTQYFFISCTLIGGICGWRVMGRRAEGPAREAPGAGVLTAVMMVIVSILFFATREMLQRSLNKIYRGPVEAVLGVFDIASEYARMLAEPGFLALLAVGGIVGGFAAGLVGRRWP